MSGLVLRGVTKAFGANSVLRGVDLEVATGSFCAILGPSGSGKTTLLRVIAGFERAGAGTVELDGVPLDVAGRHVPPNRRHIGYVPQDGSLFPHLTMAGNVGFGLSRSARRGRRVGELLEMVGLVGYERRYPHQLSGGQQQRVALARALAVSPALVVMDEPFSSLDAALRHQVRQDVRRVLAEAGATVVLVTHDQDEALSLAGTVAVIEDGRIGQCGTPSDVYREPLSPRLAQSLGDANLVTGTVRGSAVDTALGTLPLAFDGHDQGAELLVLLRPEQIELVAPRPGLPVATVTEREYYGHDALVRARCSWGDGALLTVRLSDAAALPSAGDQVGLLVRGSVVGWVRPVGGTVASAGPVPLPLPLTS